MMPVAWIRGPAASAADAPAGSLQQRRIMTTTRRTTRQSQRQRSVAAFTNIIISMLVAAMALLLVAAVISASNRRKAAAEAAAGAPTSTRSRTGPAVMAAPAVVAAVAAVGRWPCRCLRTVTRTVTLPVLAWRTPTTPRMRHRRHQQPAVLAGQCGSITHARQSLARLMPVHLSAAARCRLTLRPPVASSCCRLGREPTAAVARAEVRSAVVQLLAWSLPLLLLLPLLRLRPRGRRRQLPPPHRCCPRHHPPPRRRCCCLHRLPLLLLEPVAPRPQRRLLSRQPRAAASLRRLGALPAPLAASNCSCMKPLMVASRLLLCHLLVAPLLRPSAA